MDVATGRPALPVFAYQYTIGQVITGPAVIRKVVYPIIGPDPQEQPWWAKEGWTVREPMQEPVKPKRKRGKKAG